MLRENGKGSLWVWLFVLPVCVGLWGIGIGRVTPITFPFGAENIIIRQRHLWVFIGCFALLGAFIIHYKSRAQYTVWHKLILLLSLAGSYFLITVMAVRGDFGCYSSWNTFYVSTDSPAYTMKYSDNSIRPPVYPLFVELLTRNDNFDRSLADLKQNYNLPIQNADHALLKVIQAQKILLLLSSLIACVALMSLFGDPLLAAVLFLFLYDGGLLTHEIDFVLSETLAQSWLFLLVAVYLFYIKKRWNILLLIAAILSALLFLTRPAGIYGSVFLISMLLLALITNWRKNWGLSLVSILVWLIILFSPTIYRSISNDHGVSVTNPMYNYSQIAFALQVATADDIALMPDEESRRYLTSALEKKGVDDQRILADFPEGYSQVANLLSNNIWSVNRYALSNADSDDPSRLTQTVAGIILRHHRLDYYRFAWNSLKIMANEITRLNGNLYVAVPNWAQPVLSFWMILFLCVATAIVLRGWIGYGSLTLIAAHMGAVFVVVLYDAPSPRYVYASEFLMLIAIYILGWGVFEKLGKSKCLRRRDRGAAEAGDSVAVG